jgi:hypothetical protein
VETDKEGLSEEIIVEPRLAWNLGIQDEMAQALLSGGLQLIEI